MRRQRSTVAAMMGLVSFAAVAFAALASPSPLWAGATLMATLGVLTVALLGSIFDGGGGRAFWAGVAIVGWGYLALVFGPWLGPTFVPRLVTTSLADAVYRQLSPAPKVGETAWADISGRNREGKITKIDAGSRPGPAYSFTYIDDRGNYSGLSQTAGTFKPISRDGYRETFHCLACMLFAYFGGLIARRFAERRDRTDGPT